MAPSRSGEDRYPQEPERCPPRHGSLIVFTRLTWLSTMPELHSRVGPAVTAVEVLAEERGGLRDGNGAGLFSLADPVEQQSASTVTDQACEDSGKIAGSRDIGQARRNRSYCSISLVPRSLRFRLIQAVIRRGSC